MIFAVADFKEPNHKKFLEKVGLSPEPKYLPVGCIIAKDGKKYYYKEKFIQKKLKKFVDDFTNNALTPDLKSQNLTEKERKEDVL